MSIPQIRCFFSRTVKRFSDQIRRPVDIDVNIIDRMRTKMKKKMKFFKCKNWQRKQTSDLRIEGFLLPEHTWILLNMLCTGSVCTLIKFVIAIDVDQLISETQNMENLCHGNEDEIKIVNGFYCLSSAMFINKDRDCHGVDL